MRYQRGKRYKVEVENAVVRGTWYGGKGEMARETRNAEPAEQRGAERGTRQGYQEARMILEYVRLIQMARRVAGQLLNHKRGASDMGVMWVLDCNSAKKLGMEQKL